MKKTTLEKKGKTTTSKKLDMIPLFSDTTCNKHGGTTSWEPMYNLLEELKPEPLETKATTDAQESLDTSYFEATCSFLHRIATRPKILPCKDMVKWVIDDVDVSDRNFKNSRHEVMGSFAPDHLHQMYQLPDPQNLYNKDFDPSGYWWPPTNSTWIPSSASFSSFSFLNYSTVYYF